MEAPLNEAIRSARDLRHRIKNWLSMRTVTVTEPVGLERNANLVPLPPWDAVRTDEESLAPGFWKVQLVYRNGRIAADRVPGLSEAADGSINWPDRRDKRQG